jgi:putative ABC transport system permease protein
MRLGSGSPTTGDGGASRRRGGGATGRVPRLARAYAAIARLLPPDMRADRDDMVCAYAALLADARGRVARGVLAVRGLAALVVVVAEEWVEYLGVRRAPGRTRAEGGGMGLSRNLGFALRTLRKAPTFALTSTLLVAVGVGAVTAIFTLVDHVLLRPLPYPDAERLVTLDNGSFQGPFFRGLETLHTVQEWVAGSSGTANLVGQGDPLRVTQARVSARFLDLFGARAQRGRLLDRDDFGAADAVVLSARAWRSIWGGDPTVVGRTIQVDGQPVTVVGVLEDGFAPPERVVGSTVDLWRPLDWASPDLADDHYYILQVAGRRAPGVELPAVQDEVDALATRMAVRDRAYRTRAGTARPYPAVGLAEGTVREARTGLGFLMGAVALLLLVACANVANLFLARGLSRTREMAVRRAMGAGTRGLVGQLLVESLLVGLVGGLLGAALAWGGIRAFVSLNPGALPRQASVAVDLRVLAFAILVSGLTSLVFGLLPALRSVRGQVAEELRGAGPAATSGRGVALLRNLLVIGELALSVVLVAVAGLFVRSFLAVRTQDPGFAVAGVWTVPLNLPGPGTPETYLETMDGILRQVRGVPGVRSAAYALTAPLEWTGGASCCWSDRFQAPGREVDGTPESMVHPVTADYFSTLDLQIVAGAAWTKADATANPVPVVVNETLARNLGVVGAAMGLTGKVGPLDVVVVGVARDDRHYGLDRKIGPAVYLPMERIPFFAAHATVLARVDGRAGASLPRALRGAVWAAQPDLPVPTVRSLRDWMERSTAGRRFESAMFGTFATLALLLAAGGVYGTLLYLAGQRRHALGIRLALGASRRRLEAGVLRDGLRLGLGGVGPGLVGAWLAGGLLRSHVWGVGRNDPWSLGGAAALLLLTAVVASWLPARRAGQVDPLETLRVD